MEVTDGGKSVSLAGYANAYGRKKFFNIGRGLFDVNLLSWFYKLVLSRFVNLTFCLLAKKVFYERIEGEMTLQVVDEMAS